MEAHAPFGELRGEGGGVRAVILAAHDGLVGDKPIVAAGAFIVMMGKIYGDALSILKNKS